MIAVGAKIVRAILFDVNTVINFLMIFLVKLKLWCLLIKFLFI